MSALRLTEVLGLQSDISLGLTDRQTLLTYTFLAAQYMFSLDPCNRETQVFLVGSHNRVLAYLGQYDHHASNISLVVNLATSLVSPQFHCVFYGDFSTIEHLCLGTVPTNWAELYSNQ